MVKRHLGERAFVVRIVLYAVLRAHLAGGQYGNVGTVAPPPTRQLVFFWRGLDAMGGTHRVRKPAVQPHNVRPLRKLLPNRPFVRRRLVPFVVVQMAVPYGYVP